jgi:hypothetical protein
MLCLFFFASISALAVQAETCKGASADAATCSSASTEGTALLQGKTKHGKVSKRSDAVRLSTDYWGFGQCDYSKTEWTVPSQWCTNGYPEWSADSGEGSDASCGLADLAGVVVGNGAEQIGCASTTVDVNGESVNAATLFPYSTIPAMGGEFNADGMKTLSVFGKPIEPTIPTYTTCANNCEGGSCDAFGIPNGGNDLAKCDFSDLANLDSACVDGVGQANVGASKGWPPGSWPSVFHGTGGTWPQSDSEPAPTCDNNKFAVDQADFDNKANIWTKELYQKFKMDVADVSVGSATPGAYMCLTDPTDDTKQIKAMMSLYHGVLAQKCGDFALIRNKVEGEDDYRYLIHFSTGPRTWSLELAQPGSLYITNANNYGGMGCAIPDGAIPIDIDLTKEVSMYDPTKDACVPYTPGSL